MIMGLLLLFASIAPVLAQEQNQSTHRLYVTILEKAREKGLAREMALDECIRLVLKNNLSIEYSRYQPFLSQEALNSTMGVYDFALDTTGAYQKRESPQTNIINAQFIGNTFSSSDYNANATLSRYVSTGANVTVTLDNNRSSANYNETSPVYGGFLGLSLTQPLWKDFKIDTNRRMILNARKDVEISEIDFKDQVSNTVKSAEDVYWDLVDAIEQQNIQIQSRELAIIQLRDNQKRVEIGTLAPIEITRTLSEVAQAQQAVIAAEASIIQYQNTLKNIIANEPSDPIWELMIIPTDKPEITEKVYTAEEALKTASERRPEIKTLNISLEKNDIDIRYYENQTKPRLDLQASYGSRGTAGPNFEDVEVDGELVPNEFKGKLGTVYEQIFKQDYMDYRIAFNFQYIFGNRSAKANLASSRIQKQQNQTSMTQTLQTIRVEVLSAIQTIQVNRNNLESAIVARQYRVEQLDGETKRFQAGLATNFEVLQAQRDLSQSRAAELSARIDLKKAIVALQRFTFTNLDKYNMEFSE